MLHRFVSNKGAVIALILILIIVIMAVIGPSLSGQSYSSQTLSEKNFAPRIPVIENLGIFNGDEVLTTTGSRGVNSGSIVYNYRHNDGTPRHRGHPEHENP